MKVLAINSSPRKKNSFTYKILEKNLLQLKKINKNIQTETIFLYDYNIKYCVGCSKCKSEKGYCIINDSLNEFIEKINNIDGIIFSSPVYENHVSAILKNLFDRLHYFHFFPNPDYFNKPAINLSVTAFSGLKSTLEYMKMNIKGWGYNLIDSIGILIMNYYQDEKYKKKLSEQINKALFKFNYQLINKKEQKIDNYNLLLFDDMKNRIIQNKERFKKAYDYWNSNEWLRYDYFDNIKLNPIKKFIINNSKINLFKNY